MNQNTFVIGGEHKFASKFVERLNKRFAKELKLVISNHKTWDQSADRRENIPSNTDLVLVLKSNCNHSLRNWARQEATKDEIKFIECSHKTAIAEMDIRHCYQLKMNTDIDTTQEELDLYDTWEAFLGERIFALPILGMDDEGIFTGKDAYERMPWVKNGKKKMIAKWDKLWVAYSKESSDNLRTMLNRVASIEGRKATLEPLHILNKGKSPYFKLIEVFKSFKEGSLGKGQVKMIADQWVRDAYLGTNLRDFTSKSGLKYALGLIFGVGLDDLSPETLEVVEEHFPKPGRPKVKRTKQEREDNFLAVIESTAEQNMNTPTYPMPMTQEECDDLLAQQIGQTVAQSTDDLDSHNQVDEDPIETEEQSLSAEPYVLLGTLKLTPNDNVICIGEVQLEGGVHIYGGINLEVDRIENNTLYGVKIKKG
tara:strand:+ start:1307 stop:2581 length:1275 start_codon:yes stop_codon:yes gene_type:complete